MSCSVEDLYERAMGRRNRRTLPVKTLGISRPYHRRTWIHRPSGRGSQQSKPVSIFRSEPGCVNPVRVRTLNRVRCAPLRQPNPHVNRGGTPRLASVGIAKATPFVGFRRYRVGHGLWPADLSSPIAHRSGRPKACPTARLI